MREKALDVLPFVERDPWLEPCREPLMARYRYYRAQLSEIEENSGSIVDYANGYLYFGFQYDPLLRGRWFREWLPEAEDVYLFGDFNGWQRTELPLRKGGDGVWTIFLPDETFGDRLVHGSRVTEPTDGWSAFPPTSVAWCRTSGRKISADSSGRLPCRSTGGAMRSISLRWAAC